LIQLRGGRRCATGRCRSTGAVDMHVPFGISESVWGTVRKTGRERFGDVAPGCGDDRC
jgi:hypothetical protein